MKSTVIAPALSVLALVSAQGVQAQQACVAPADLSDTVTYAMPLLYDAMQAPCGAKFASDPFMISRGEAFIQRFRVRQDAAWPGTFRLLKVFIAQRGLGEGSEGGDAQMVDMISQLPEDSLRPFIDGIVTQMISERLANEIEPSTCSDISEAMALIEPLPAENVSDLVTFLARQADVDEPSICAVKAS